MSAVRARLGLAAFMALGTIPVIVATSNVVAEPPTIRSQLRVGPSLNVRVRESADSEPAALGADAPAMSLRATVTPDLKPPGGSAETGDGPAARQLEPLTTADATDASAVTGAPPAELQNNGVPGEVPSEVFAAQFLDVVPGQTTKNQVHEQFGRPDQEFAGDKSVIRVYRIGPFPRVEFRIESDVVQSIRVQFADPMSRQKVLADLGLGEFETALLTDSRGEVRGEIVPERGLQLTWSHSGEPPEITQIVLEVPQGAYFVRRAKQDPWQRYQRMLSDLAAAKRLEPQSVEALAVEARIRQRLGQPTAALELATSAAQLDEQSADIRLLRASLLGENGQHAEALRQVDQVISNQQVPAELRAYARCLRGELILASPTGRPELALEHFQRALAEAGKLTKSSSVGTQRAARDVLLVSYLGGAAAIAQGKWTNRAATVETWWNSAHDISRDAEAGDQGATLERWNVLRRHLQLASLAGGRIPSQEMDALRLDARHLSDRAGDPLLTSRIDWDLAEALLYAAELAQANRLWPEAREYAEEGLDRARSAAASREPGFATDYLQGRLAFLLGAYHAMVSKDGEQIQHWLDQAGQRFATSYPLPAVEQLRHGERLVFMGQAYAELGNREAAERWFTRGIELLEPLAERGTVPPERATAPLKKLAALQHSQGKQESAAELTARAAKLTKRP